MPKFLDTPQWYDDSGVLLAGSGWKRTTAGLTISVNSTGIGGAEIIFPQSEIVSSFANSNVIVVGVAGDKGLPTSTVFLIGYYSLSSGGVAYGTVMGMGYYYATGAVSGYTAEYNSMSVLFIGDFDSTWLSSPAFNKVFVMPLD